MEQVSSFFIYNNLKIAYSTIGKGKPLIILHGWGSSSRVMAVLSKSLCEFRTCYLIDLPGFGDSAEPPVPWGIDDYADMVEVFIDSLEMRPVDMLVHSFGGRITLKLLARRDISKHIDKVLITGGAGLKPKRSFSFYLKKYVAKTVKAPILILPGKKREKALDWLRGTSLWKNLGSSDYSKLSGVMRGTFVKSVTEHLDHLLPGIDHDVLLLWGENDDATPLYQGQRMEKGLKNSALVVIENAGHYAFLDKPKRFASIATAYFKTEAM